MMSCFYLTGRKSKMKVEVSFFIGGSIHKEIVFVERFEDAEKVAKARQPVGRMVNRKILMN